MGKMSKLKKFWKENGDTIIAVSLIIIGLFCLIYFVIIPLTSDETINVNVNDNNMFEIDTVPPKSGEECTDCQFLVGLKDYSNLVCNPTQEQLDTIKGLNESEIKNCGTNLCYSRMNSLITKCFESNNQACSSCEFKNLFSQECMTQAYNNIKPDSNNLEFEQKYQITSKCGCIPSTSQINLFNSQLSNTDPQWLLKCRNVTDPKDDCYTETIDLISKCNREKLPADCNNCEFILSMTTSECVPEYISFMDFSDEEELDLEPDIQYAITCGCYPNNEQIGVLESVRLSGTDPKTCGVDPYCPETLPFLNKYNCIPAALPPTEAPTQPPLQTVPPGLPYPEECSNCEFIDKLKDGCVSEGYNLVEPGQYDDFKKLYVSQICGCTPTDNQILATNNIITSGLNPIDCGNDPSNCSPIETIHNSCTL
jgi:hypothetical protein